MKIRELKSRDLEAAWCIYQKYYQDEFAFPNFLKFSSAWTITDDEDKPIIVGGIKPIAESIIITDKDYHARIRREALYKNLEASAHISSKLGFTQIHCAIQDAAYERHLKKVGFRPVKGNFLVLDV